MRERKAIQVLSCPEGLAKDKSNLSSQRVYPIIAIHQEQERNAKLSVSFMLVHGACTFAHVYNKAVPAASKGTRCGRSIYLVAEGRVYENCLMAL